MVLTGGGAELKNIADYMQGVLGRAVRVGRPEAADRPARRAQRPGLLDAGRARLLAASGSGDIRDIALGPIAQRKPPSGMIGRLIAAMKGGYLAGQPAAAI